MFETAIGLFGDRVFAYYYDIPFEETLKRHEKKDKRFDFGEAEMCSWWIEKDFIGIIPEKVFTQEITLEGAMESILKDVSFEI